LCRKYKQAVPDLKDSQDALQSLESTGDPALIALWSRQAAQAQKDRDNQENAMDIYDVTSKQGLSTLVLPPGIWYTAKHEFQLQEKHKFSFS
jgi:hypothetical protein